MKVWTFLKVRETVQLLHFFVCYIISNVFTHSLDAFSENLSFE